MFQFEPPRSTKSFVDSQAALQEEIRDYFRDLPLEQFFASQGQAWSPAGHLRHLIKSTRPLVRAMKLPKLLLGLLFGRSMAGSRSFEQVRDMYLAAIDEGLQAGRFAPSKAPPRVLGEDERTKILEEWDATGEAFLHVLGRWSESNLDSHRLPHPGMGKLTVREMLYFTLYHDAHHARRVVERSGAAAT